MKNKSFPTKEILPFSLKWHWSTINLITFPRSVNIDQKIDFSRFDDSALMSSCFGQIFSTAVVQRKCFEISLSTSQHFFLGWKKNSLEIIIIQLIKKRNILFPHHRKVMSFMRRSLKFTIVKISFALLNWFLSPLTTTVWYTSQHSSFNERKKSPCFFTISRDHCQVATLK